MISIQENQLSDIQLKLIKDKEELEKLLNLNINKEYKREANRIIDIYAIKVKEIISIVKRENFLIEKIEKKHLEIKEVLKNLVTLCYRFEDNKKVQRIIDSIHLKEIGIIFVIIDNLTQNFSKKKLSIDQEIYFFKLLMRPIEEQKKIYLAIDNKDLPEGYIDSIFYVLIKVNFLVVQTKKSLKEKIKIDQKNRISIENLKSLDNHKKQLHNLIHSFVVFSKKTNEDLAINLSGISWEIYDAISETISDVSWCKISYANGVLRLVTNGEKHENFKGNIGDLIVYFCDFKEIDYYNFGSKTEKNDKLGVSKEPDVSYGFNGNKKTIDLAVEVNYSSGSLKDLERYKVLEIKEVWMWDNKENLLFFSLEDDQYIEIKTSRFLAPLTPEIIKQCAILMREKKAITGKKEMIRIVEELELI